MYVSVLSELFFIAVKFEHITQLIQTRLICLNFAECTYIDQNGDGVNHCFLKATTDGRQPTRNLVSGRKTCSGCKASKSCQDPGVDYYYGDIRTVLGSATPDECACQCEKVNECGSWTWAKGCIHHP